MKDTKRLATTDTRQLYADPAAAAAQAVDKIAACRIWLLKEKPFFGVLARALVVEPTLRVAAFRVTTDDRLLVNPIVVLQQSFAALCARVAHVALHAALGALVRRGTRDALRWNLAHDLAIEPLLAAAQLPTGAVLPPSAMAEVDAGAEDQSTPTPFRLASGASAEEYYLVLKEGARPDDLWCDLADPPPPDEAPPAGRFTRQDDDEGREPGSSGAGDSHEGAPDAPQAQGDEPEPEPPIDASTDVDARARELQWKMRLAAALEEERASGGKTFGEVPAWIEELVRASIEPPPDWTAILQRSIALLTRSDRSFLRPSRRMSALAGTSGAWPDVVTMPGRRIVAAGRLVSVIDTSASIGDDLLRRFLGALAAVATAEGFDDVRLVQADAEVTHDESVFAADLLFQPIAIVGRGGTNFGPALEMLALESRRSGERFTVAYLTDLDGRFPDASAVRPLDVLWIVPGKAARVPPFGTVIEMAL